MKTNEMNMDTESKNYSEYAVKLISDPVYYGSECTQDDAEKIVEKLSRMIQREFPGVDVSTWQEGAESSATTGPDSEVVDEINQWISDNWTAAL